MSLQVNAEPLTRAQRVEGLIKKYEARETNLENVLSIYKAKLSEGPLTSGEYEEILGIVSMAEEFDFPRRVDFYMAGLNERAVQYELPFHQLRATCISSILAPLEEEINVSLDALKASIDRAESPEDLEVAEKALDSLKSGKVDAYITNCGWLKETQKNKVTADFLAQKTKQLLRRVNLVERSLGTQSAQFALSSFAGA